MTFPWLKAVEVEFSERLGQARLPHALLLSGPRGTGKKFLAEAFTAGILCLEGGFPACGKCRSCQLLESGAHPDRHVITFEEHPRTGDLRGEIVVDQVRRLIASLNLTNTISRRKAALIHPAEAMNTNSANALLKTLEEPPGDSILILVSHDPSRLPPTIRSRCQNLYVRLPGPTAAGDWLCCEEGFDPDESKAALQAAAGSPLVARDMIKNSTTEQYRLLIATLDDLGSGRMGFGAAMAALADIEHDLLWSWISLFTADRIKTGGHPHELALQLSILQSAADKNRKLVATPVRKDFLLQDWLIQWAALKA
jgi:DNA polymerase-3 subunit delta'